MFFPFHSIACAWILLYLEVYCVVYIHVCVHAIYVQIMTSKYHSNCNFFSEVSDAVFLNKTDYIGVSLRQMQGAFSVKMRFKTRNGEGLLLSTKKREKGLYVAVYNGKIQVSIDNKRGKTPFCSLHDKLSNRLSMFCLWRYCSPALGHVTVP